MIGLLQNGFDILSPNLEKRLAHCRLLIADTTPSIGVLCRKVHHQPSLGITVEYAQCPSDWHDPRGAYSWALPQIKFLKHQQPRSDISSELSGKLLCMKSPRMPGLKRYCLRYKPVENIYGLHSCCSDSVLVGRKGTSKYPDGLIGLIQSLSCEHEYVCSSYEVLRKSFSIISPCGNVIPLMTLKSLVNFSGKPGLCAKR